MGPDNPPPLVVENVKILVNSEKISPTLLLKYMFFMYVCIVYTSLSFLNEVHVLYVCMYCVYLSIFPQGSIDVLVCSEVAVMGWVCIFVLNIKIII